MRQDSFPQLLVILAAGGGCLSRDCGKRTSKACRLAQGEYPYSPCLAGASLACSQGGVESAATEWACCVAQPTIRHGSSVIQVCIQVLQHQLHTGRFSADSHSSEFCISFERRHYSVQATGSWCVEHFESSRTLNPLVNLGEGCSPWACGSGNGAWWRSQVRELERGYHSMPLLSSMIIGAVAVSDRALFES